jgi:hypothetical protein
MIDLEVTDYLQRKKVARFISRGVSLVDIFK